MNPSTNRVVNNYYVQVIYTDVVLKAALSFFQTRVKEILDLKPRLELQELFH